MSTFLNYLIIGTGSGAAYALLALGAVLIYRGSGVVNFAQGAMALVGAAVYYQLEDAGAAVAITAALVSGAVFGALFQLLVLRFMRSAAPLTRTIVTLALASAIVAAANIKYGTDAFPVEGFLPTGAWQVGGVHIVYSWLCVLGAALVAMLVLWYVFAHSRTALATTAAAENPQVASAAGWSPDMLALINWAIGGLLASLAGVFLVPLTSLQSDSLYLTVLPAIAACLVGAWSFPWVFLSAIAIGVIESETTAYVSAPGWSTAIPFIAILGILVLRGEVLPTRGHTADRLPRLGTGHVNWPLIAVALAGAMLSVAYLQPQWAVALTDTALFALIGLSLVALVGYCGQISLAQYGLAGVAALLTGQLASHHWPFLLAVLAGAILTVPVGVLVALPAVRTRGVSLAVVTLAFGSVITSVVLANPSLTGGLLVGLQIPDQRLFGIDFNPVINPQNFTYLCLIILALCGLGLANLRRSRSGLSMIAVRNNERAAASIGISVSATKIHAFVVSTMLASLAGGLFAVSSSRVDFTQYTPDSSINALLLTVIGGLGLIGGGIVGAAGTVGGIVYYFLQNYISLTDWFTFITAVIVIPIIVRRPDGVAMDQVRAAAWIRAKVAAARAARRPSATADKADKDDAPITSRAALDTAVPVKEKRLELRDVTVRFGGVIAVDGFSLFVNPGEVVGLIGPNGAGKTTLIDAATGFVRTGSGTITLGGEPIQGMAPYRRARRGLSRSFQSLELFEDLTVRDNLLLGDGFIEGGIRRTLDVVKPTKRVLSPRALQAVHELGLSEVLDRYPRELAYAQRRIVAMARAIASGPSILLLDEPAAGLDVTSTRALGELIKRVSRSWQVGILLIEHDVAMVLSCCDRVVAMDFGRQIAVGTPDEVRSNPVVVDAYLGPALDEDMRIPGDTAIPQQLPIVSEQ